MTVSELVERSGIREDKNFQELDYAIPMNQETGEYPHDGRAISVYYTGRFIPEIVSYFELKILAKRRIKEILTNYEGVKLLKSDKSEYYRLVQFYFKLTDLFL